jgi:hypothetical protein
MNAINTSKECYTLTARWAIDATKYDHLTEEQVENIDQFIF